jgi:hypothetical protein
MSDVPLFSRQLLRSMLRGPQVETKFSDECIVVRRQIEPIALAINTS